MTPPAHHNAPKGTSDEAARRIAPVAPNQRGRVLAAITEAGTHGLTDDEGERITKMLPQSYTPRRGELVRLGLVVNSGRKRPTASGCPAAVWIAAEYAEHDGPTGKGVNA